jgi:hypothetical protein
MPDGIPEIHGWISQAVVGLGMSSTALGAWVLRTSTRQARLESKLESMEKSNDEDHAEVKAGIKQIVDHLTKTHLG